MAAYCFTYNRLLVDLHQAYYDARRHKRNKPYQLRFEQNLEENLCALCDELWTRTYRPERSTCFIVRDPSLREIFAAEFRDRIVHHLYFNYTHTLFERTFIQDSYSCIRGRGTHYGIRRLREHILKASQNYSEQCFVLKMDIQGYFVHINRERLLQISTDTLRRMSSHKIYKDEPGTWQDVMDFDFLEYLTGVIVLQNPVVGCVIKGNLNEWQSLPDSKSLFKSGEECGLPIGNLTSQLFSNVYLNKLDQYMKRELGCRHYGRYVDDFYVVSPDRDWLKGIVAQVEEFLQTELDLCLNRKKLTICDVRYGVEYLGAYLLPHRTYVSNRTLARMRKKINALGQRVAVNVFVKGEKHTEMTNTIVGSMNSFMGVLSHYRTYNIRRDMVRNNIAMLCYGRFTNDRLKFIGTM